VLGLRVALWSKVLVQDHLRNAGAIAQIEEDEIAMVAATVHPTHQHYMLACLCGAKLPTSMGAL
jgi:hypothetical protein